MGTFWPKLSLGFSIGCILKWQFILYEKHMNTYNWYSQLVKPTWSPPAWIFGPVWTFLYILIAFSYGTVFYKVFTKQWPVVVVVPFILNLVFNVAFTPLQFGLQNNLLAAIDITFILGTLIWAMIVIYPYAPWITYI